MPPSSRGPGRSPFKAKTGVRISVEAQKITLSGDLFITLLGRSLRSGISVEAPVNQITTRPGGYWFRTDVRWRSGITEEDPHNH